MNATQLHIPTGEIKVGDVVLTHGMRVRIDEIRTYEDRGTVYACFGTVLNLDEVRAAHFIPPSFLFNAARDISKDAPGAREDVWNVQGNDLAWWIVERVESLKPKRPAGPCVRCGKEVRADRKGYFWSTNPNDGQPLWCESAPDKRHVSSLGCSWLVARLDELKITREARDRIRAAIVNSGETWPAPEITVSLPARLPERSSADLAIAVSVLAANGAVPAAALAGVVFLAELGLDGSLRPVPGVQPAVAAAAESGPGTVIVASGDAAEAALMPGMRVIAAHTLAEVTEWLRSSPAGLREES